MTTTSTIQPADRLGSEAASGEPEMPPPATGAAATAARGQVDFDASFALVLRERARGWRERVPLVVDSDLMLTVAAQDLQAIKALLQEVEAQRVAITGPLNEALRAVNALFRAPRQYLEEAEGILKQAILMYSGAERQRICVQRSQAQQRRSAELQRLTGEQHRLELAARAADEAAGAQEASAARAESAGNLQAAAQAREAASEQRTHAESAWAQARAAAQLLEDAQVVTCPGDLEATPRVEGISERTTYAAQVTDLRLLVGAVASGQAPLECLQASDKFLGAQARARRRAGELYPGVQVTRQRGLSSRRVPSTV